MDRAFLAQEIKRRVKAKDLFAFYGFLPNKVGFVRCPFHGEKTPSLKVYEGDRGFHCFGCGEGGSVIDFVMRFFEKSFQQAVAKINDDFSLGLPIGEKRDRRQMLEDARMAFERKKERERLERFGSELKERHRKALAEWWAVKDALEQSKPTFGEQPNPLFLAALKEIEFANINLELAEEALLVYEKGSV